MKEPKTSINKFVSIANDDYAIFFKNSDAFDALPGRLHKYIDAWNGLVYGKELDFYSSQGLDLVVFFKTMYDWVEANPKKANKYKNWNRALKNWLNKALKDLKGQGVHYGRKKTNPRRCRKDGKVRI